MSNVPKLRFKEFSGEWKEKKLGDIAKVTMGQSPDSNSYNDNNIGLPLIQGNADCKNRKTNPRIFTSQKTKECFVNDIIMTVRAPVGAVSKSYHHACIGRGVCSIKAKESNNFLYQFLIDYENKWTKYSQGSTFTAVNGNDIKGLKLNIPIIKEQEKIASFLTSIDTKIEQLTKKEELLQQYKKGVMQKIFNQEIRFKADDESEFCEWKEKKVSEMFDVTRGYVLAVTKMSEQKTEEFQYPVYSSQTKNKGLTGYFNEYLYEDSITWTTDGANAGDVNFRKGKFYCTNVCGVLKSSKGYANECIAQILNSVTERYVSYVGNPKLMNNTMGTIKIKIPSSIEEQNKIANFLSSIDTKIEQVQKQLEQTKEFKKALLQQMFV